MDADAVTLTGPTLSEYAALLTPSVPRTHLIPLLSLVLLCAVQTDCDASR